MSRLPAPKRRRLSPPEEGRTSATGKKDRLPSFYENASKWNIEDDYQQRARKNQKNERGQGRLPVKTAEGRVEHLVVPEPSAVEPSVVELHNAKENIKSTDTAPKEPEEQVPQLSTKEQIFTAKEDLARIAGLISEDPEENAGQLKSLAQIASSPILTVKKLALATQLAVYKDIIPGYRIRPVSEEERKAKLSKDVRRLRDLEQGLVGGYHAYVQDLAKTAKAGRNGSSEAERGLGSVAIACVCTLLNSVPHFNFRGDLLNVIVSKLSTKDLDQDFTKCRNAIETLFQNDEEGQPSLEAVQLLAKMFKTSGFNVHESVLNTFLHLRLLSEFTHKGSQNRIDKSEDQDEQDGKKLKQKREFRTKKERKNMKERKVVEKEFREADAIVSHEERDKNQAEMLKLVFIAYFRILKAKTPGLMGAVLEGLARYAHLVNQDFFGDILEALRELIINVQRPDVDQDENAEEEPASRDASRESLLCVITAFALLQGQDAAKSAAGLQLDLNFFITHLYQTLLPASMNTDIELSAKSLHLPDPHDPNAEAIKKTHKVNVQTTAALLVRSLSSVLLPPLNVRAVPPLRLAAFAKQLLTASLHLPERSCLAMIGLLRQVVKVQGNKIAALWYTEERKGDGVFDPLREEVEASNPFAATAWEGEVLRLHYCPDVREGISGLQKAIAASRS